MNSVSIITVNYYSEKDILQCIDSIKSVNTVSFEFIIVTNSKVDDAFESEVKAIHSDSILIESGGNLGFAKACNLGSMHANGEYLFFLNPDTRFLNDTLKELIKCFKRNDDVGIAGPKTFNQNLQPEPSAKHEISLKYYATLLLPFLSDSESYRHFLPSETTEVPVLNGHALLLKKHFYKELNGMEEDFFMYWEENDLCYRVKKSGKKIIFCSDAEIIHISGTSTSPYFHQMEIEKHRSQKKFINKHFPQFKILNRITGTLAYAWRATFSLITFRPAKFNQFWNLFIWYCFRYN